jgi:hypothetical protein
LRVGMGSRFVWPISAYSERTVSSGNRRPS